ncbi:MAG TPA: N-methyl-L-tryptophan oxidase [Ktedonobacterales bacterium]|jgi:monomeric sarcosine oxidase|nr:N-methyl-L-tryptophan oxidase [Ktedonobacterales bacterium]
MAQRTAIVVGGGVMGLSAACALAGRGVAVTLLERFVLGHDWASSHGLTRAIRHEYGPDEIYTRMVARSLVLWDDLAQETGHYLYTETGVLTFGQPNDGHTLAGYEVMRAAGLPVEQLAAEECRRRFPQFNPRSYKAITYNPTGGMLHASDCLLALADRLRMRGGTIREGVHVTRVEPQGEGGRVLIQGGDALSADLVVVTAGPWVHDLLPDVKLPVRPTRQQVCYLSELSPQTFGVGVFPVFLASMEYYGFPLQGPGWLKVGCHTSGPQVDPNLTYEADLQEVADVRAFLRRVIPRAAAGKLMLVDRCMYDITPDEDFILDVHPGGKGVIIGSGFSGHGFKFGPLIGELLASVALGEEPELPLERFHLSRFITSHKGV